MYKSYFIMIFKFGIFKITLFFSVTERSKSNVFVIKYVGMYLFVYLHMKVQI